MTSYGRCEKCYKQLEPDAKFCGSCGHVVGGALDPNDQQATNAISGIQCPSCKHENLTSARFCESCGTQLQRFSAAGTGAEAGASDLRGHSHAPGAADPGPSASEDPWATGPAYNRQLREDEECPRCSSYTGPNETVCANCGLPLGQSANADGIPYDVALAGNPAGFWIRLVALIIDGVIFNVGTGIIGFLFGVNTFTGSGVDEFSTGVQAIISTFQFIGPTVYNVLFLVYSGTTPGKRLFNIYILDANGSKKIGFGRALGRELSKFISAAILLIGFIMVAFRIDKRALHDLLAGTFPTTIHRRRRITGSSR